MPLSGCIALKYCITACDCSSVSCAVNGSAIGNISLTTLSEQVGWGLPHCMSEFYGYPSGGTVHVCLGLGFNHRTAPTPHSYVCSNISGAISAPEGICIHDVSFEGVDVGGVCFYSNNLTDTYSNFICYNSGDTGYCYCSTDQTIINEALDDTCWIPSGPGVGFAFVNFRANNTIITAPSPGVGSCITLTNGDIVEFCFNISCCNVGYMPSV